MTAVARRAAALVLVLAAAMVGLLPETARAAPPEEVFALVVAHNQSLDPTVRPLRYADDDGARFFEWARVMTDQAVLLTVLDAETQRLHPGLAARTRPPTRAHLQAAMDTLVAAMAQARQRGARTVFYFYFAGHGDVGNDREGYINLVDGRFSRSDLYREVIGRSTADLNHVIVDACNSYFLVNRRGVQSRRATPDEAIRSFLRQETLDRYPNTGVVLSTASAAESHEWSRYRSGIFSHQLLSALWGAADIDGDGRVDYRELTAYVAAANLRVRDGRARLSIFARPPTLDRGATLVDLTRLPRVAAGEARPATGRLAGFLTVPQGLRGHYYLEDDRGVRYLDFNKTDEQPLRMALLDRPFYYLRSAGPGAPREALIPLTVPGDPEMGRLAFVETPTGSRGTLEQSFRRDLYAFPFGQSFLAGHAAAAPDEEGAAAVPAPTAEVRPWFARARTWKWVTAGAALAAAATATGLQVASVRNFAQVDALPPGGPFGEALGLSATADRQRLGAAIGFGIAGTAAVTSLILFLVDRDPPSGARLGALARPGGAGLTLQGLFWSF